MAVVDTLLDRNVDGLVLIGGDISDEGLNRLSARLPTVLVGRRVDGWEDRSICVDNEQGGFDATKHLIDSGHREIVCIHGLRQQPDAVDRYKGHCRALNEAGLPISDEHVYFGDFSGRSGILAVASFLERSVHFTAVVAANDTVAFGARLALYRKGIRVPEDVSIIGFDDQAEAALMTPPLTTMRQPAVEMGLSSASLLLSLFDKVPKGNDGVPFGHQIELVVRESVARI